MAEDTNLGNAYPDEVQQLIAWRTLSIENLVFLAYMRVYLCRNRQLGCDSDSHFVLLPRIMPVPG